MKKQTVWRTMTGGETTGYYVWEILEVVGEKNYVANNFSTKNFIQCRDGSYILIHCDHFWTEERATEILFANDKLFNQHVIVIDIPEETKANFPSWRDSAAIQSLKNKENWTSEEIKIGDRVYSEELGVGGVVTRIERCNLDGCTKSSLCLDRGNPTFEWFHVKNFRKVD